MLAAVLNSRLKQKKLDLIQGTRNERIVNWRKRRLRQKA
jgi:hypothetical protein